MIRYSPLYFFRFILAVFKRQLREKLQNFFCSKMLFSRHEYFLEPVVSSCLPEQCPRFIKYIYIYIQLYVYPKKSPK